MSDRQLIADLLSALEYHTEQTRPIEFSRVAIDAAREYLKTSAQPAQAEARPCHVFNVTKNGALIEWEPTTMAFALSDGKHALYTAPQQAEAVQACGHSMSLLLRSAESNAPLYCEACDDKSGRHDAERRETELLDANRRLQEKIGSADALKLHAVEELCQLGYTVKDGELFPPDHLHKLMEAAGHPLAVRKGGAA